MTHLESNRTYARPRPTIAGLSAKILPTLIVAGLLALVPAGILVASEPTAGEIIDKYVEATGGAEAYGKIDNRVVKGTLDLGAQGITLGMTIFAAKPNKNYTLIESDATGKMERGTDGEVVWEVSAMMGPQIKEGQERADYLREASFDRWTHWRDIYEKADYEGVETVDDAPAHKIVLTPKDGKAQTYYFDQASNLVVKVEFVLENPMGTIPLVSYLGDYKEVDGLLIPHSARIVVMSQERVMTTTSVEHNVDLPEDRFALPAEIRALVEESEGDSAAESD